MLLQIIILYDVCDTVLNNSGHHDDPQTALTTSEVMTCALVAAWFFAGNVECARGYLLASGDISSMVGKSRLNRRMHSITNEQWAAVLRQVTDPAERTFLLDSCPMPVCQYVRSRRSRLYQDKAYYGYCAAKQMRFYGLKVHLVTTANEQPVESNCSQGVAVTSPRPRKARSNLPCLLVRRSMPTKAMMLTRSKTNCVRRSKFS